MLKVVLFSFLTFLLPVIAKSSVVVQSTYTSPTGKSITIKGTGALVSFEHDKLKKLFVITVAHLTGGQDLLITVDGQPAQILGSATLSRQDLALYEVQLSQAPKPISNWNFKEKEFNTTFIRSAGFVTNTLTQETHRAFEIGIDRGVTAKEVFGKIGGYQAPAQPTQFIGLPKNYQDGRARPYDRKTNGTLAANIRYTPMGRIVFETSIAPGMSGAPIFKFLRNEANGTATYKLAGFATQYSRALNYSFGITSNVAYELMRSYLVKNVRGEQVESFKGRKVFTRWKYNGSTTYREIYDSKTNQVIAQESSSIGNAGNELFGDSGEGTNGDGGEGTNGDGGEGTNGDGGEGTNGDGGNGSKSCPVSNLKSGIILDGKHVEYLKFSDKQGRYVIVQANLTALDFIFRYGSKFKVQAIQVPAEQRFQYFVSRSALFRPMSEGIAGLHITRIVPFAQNQFQTSHMNTKDGGAFDVFVFDVSPQGISGDMRWKTDQSAKTKSQGSWQNSFLEFSSQKGFVNYRMHLADLYSLNLDNVDFSEIKASKPFESLYSIYSTPRFFFNQTAQGCK